MRNFNSVLDGLSREDLQDLVSQGVKRLAAMRPVHIRHLYKRCGKDTCWCFQADKTDGHGPYLYAIYTDRGMQYQKSLGSYFTEDQIQAMLNRACPGWLDFVVRRVKDIERLRQTNKWYEFSSRRLTFGEFEEFYGVSVEEDKMSHPRDVWYNYVEFQKAVEKWQAAQDRLTSSFASLGVVSEKGYSTLKSLTDRGFYLVV